MTVENRPVDIEALERQTDIWLSWLDDLPVPADFDEGIGSLQEHISAMRDALLAPRIKPLWWVERGSSLLSGDYRIVLSSGQGPAKYLLSRATHILGWHHSQETGKAAAQADYIARIMAALKWGE